ncbi:MAG TPA: hypothetical protein VGF24_29635 [Vicinamibacterales bacterium]
MERAAQHAAKDIAGEASAGKKQLRQALATDRRAEGCVKPTAACSDIDDPAEAGHYV